MNPKHRLVAPFLSLILIAGLPAQAADDPPDATKPASKVDAPGWKERHEKINALVKQTRNADLIFVGDSITQRWEGAGADVWKQYYGSRKALNLGIDGDQTQHVLWRLQNGNLDGISPKLAVVMIGTNNAGGPAEQTASGIKSIIDELRARLPKTKILLLALFPRGADATDPARQKNATVNAIIRKLDDGQAVLYFDINDRFLGPDGALSKEMMPDLLHPNSKGYAAWAEAIEPVVWMNLKNSMWLPLPDRSKATVAVEVTVTFAEPLTTQFQQGGIWMHRNLKGEYDVKLVRERINGKDVIHPGGVTAPEKSVRLRMVFTKDKYTSTYQPDAKGEFRTVATYDLPFSDEERVCFRCGDVLPGDDRRIRFSDFRIVEVK